MPTLHPGQINIAFDGNVFVGKTFLLKSLRKKFGYHYIPEHSELIKRVRDENTFSNDFMNVHYKFMRTDELRRRYLKPGYNLLDRSFVSFSAFVYSLKKMGVANIEGDYLTQLATLMEKGDIIIPDFYIHTIQDYSTSRQRYLDNNDRHAPGYLMSKDFYRYFDQFCECWVEQTSGLKLYLIEECEFNLDLLERSSLKYNSKQLVELTKQIMS